MTDAQKIATLEARIVKLEAALAAMASVARGSKGDRGERGERGQDGHDGKDGRDGRSVSTTQLAAMITDAVAHHQAPTKKATRWKIVPNRDGTTIAEPLP